MVAHFEAPNKTRLRQRCAEAVDAAGHRVVDPPQKIALPPELGLRGGILPDVQSVGADGLMYNYYVRPGPVGGKSIPGWLTNLSRAVHQVENAVLYVVVEETGRELEDSCRAVGAGLLILRNDLRMGHVLDPLAQDPSVVSKRTLARISSVRRKMETKLHLNLNQAQTYFDEVRAAMSHEAGAKYLAGAERISNRWRAWGDRLSERLDAVAVTGDELELNAIEAEIEAGVR